MAQAATVTDVQALLAAGPSAVDVVLSFLAPRFGHLEDQMLRAGFRLVSISPHARMQHPLIVPFVNGSSVDFGALRCVKSPNCCSVGASVALRPLVDMFDVQEVFITTFQTLSGRGDALYPPEKVVANVFPIGATEEKTEQYIAQEVARVYQVPPGQPSGKAEGGSGWRKSASSGWQRWPPVNRLLVALVGSDPRCSRTARPLAERAGTPSRLNRNTQGRRT